METEPRITWKHLDPDNIGDLLVSAAQTLPGVPTAYTAPNLYGIVDTNQGIIAYAIGATNAELITQALDAFLAGSKPDFI